MDPFEVVEHTADVGIRASGATLKDAFENAALGMFALMADLSTAGETNRWAVSASARDRAGLLVDLLNELLVIFEVEHAVLARLEITDWDEKTRATGYVYGETIDPEKHKLLHQIKAPTYHMLEVSHDGGWSAQVIFDV